MRLTIAVIATSLLIAACTGAPPQTSPDVAPASPTGPATQPTEVAPEPTPAPTPVAPAPTAPPAGNGGPVGPVYTGDLASAIPKVVGGEPVQVTGPIDAAAMAGLGFDDEVVLAVLEQLGLQPGDAEIAIGYNESNTVGVLILAMRFRGADSATLDRAFMSIQEQTGGTRNVRVVSVAGRSVHAFDSLIGTNYAWVNGDIVFWLFGTDQGAQQAIAAMPLPTVALQPTNGELLPQAEIDLTLTGGPHAGTHRGVALDGGCSRSGENSFGLQYSTIEPGIDFSSLQLILNDAAAAQAGGTADFFASVEIGPLFSGTTYRLNPDNGEGTGDVRLQDDGVNNAVIEISGTTADGVGVRATVTCHSVFDFGG